MLIRSSIIWAVALGAALLTGSQARAQAVATITVEAGEVERVDTPVVVEVGDMPGDGVKLVEIKGDRRVDTAVQVEGKRVSFILSGTTGKGQKRTFELAPAASMVRAAVTLREDEKQLTVACRGTDVLRYYHAVMPPPAGQDPRYARSGFIHPLWTPGGKVLTNIHPKDHIHHLGLWNPWTNTEFEGRHVDFWNIKDGTGTVRFVKFAAKTSGPVYGGFQAVQEHVALNASGGPKVALNEVFDVRVYNVGGPGAGGYWLIDVTSTQRCASSSPLKLVKYRYGGIGFRATADWTEANSNYLTSEGKDRKTGHGTRSRWCNMFGQTKQGPAGVEFMSHPQNREHPEPMRIWPEGDIFFNYCPIQASEWVLEPGNDYVLKYRIVTYDGTMDKAACERMWQDFGNPPKVTVQASAQ